MSLIKEFTSSIGNTSFSFRVERALQHIDFRRTSAMQITGIGLILGLPEVISAEITHPVRDRVRLGNDVEMSHAALWAEHGRGPIAESVPAYNPGLPADQQSPSANPFVGVGGLTTAAFKFYVNDLGPIEILADDHFIVTVENCIPGATYQVYAPEQQVNGAEANKYFAYEPGVILATDRERTLSTVGKQGIILPNRPDVIQRVMLTALTPEGAKEESELDMFELMAVQTDSNPFVSVLSYTSSEFSLRRTLLAPSGVADLLLIMFNGVQSIQLDTVIGQELKYTLVGVKERV